MDIKFELLQYYICDYLRELFETFPLNASKLIDSEAIKALDEIKTVIGNDELSDFYAIEEIVCILEKYNIYCGGRHDF